MSFAPGDHPASIWGPSKWSGRQVSLAPFGWAVGIAYSNQWCRPATLSSFERYSVATDATLHGASK